MSLYKEYLEERTNDKCLEWDYGFITYRFVDPNIIYAIDVYVKPEFRRSGVGLSMYKEVEKIGIDHQCEIMLGTVVPSAHGSTESIKVLLSDPDVKVDSSSNNLIVFKKILNVPRGTIREE